MAAVAIIAGLIPLVVELIGEAVKSTQHRGHSARRRWVRDQLRSKTDLTHTDLDDLVTAAYTPLYVTAQKVTKLKEASKEAYSEGAQAALVAVSQWLDASGVAASPRGLHGAAEQVAVRIASLKSDPITPLALQIAKLSDELIFEGSGRPFAMIEGEIAALLKQLTEASPDWRIVRQE